MFKTESIRHAWPEKAGFAINRPKGHWQYTFLHFFNSVEILAEGKLTKAPPHACILYRPGTPQYFISRQPLTHDWIHFSGDISGVPGLSEFQPDRLYLPPSPDFITGIVRECEAEFFGTRPCRDELLEIKTKELFIRLSRSVSGEDAPAVGFGTEERLRKLRGEVFSSLRHRWTVEEMAREVSLSQSRFFSVYRSIYGTSPVGDLINAKIDRAKSELAMTDSTLAVISESLGYGSTAHFIRQFRAVTGMSPGAYRKEFRQKTNGGK